LIVAGQRPIGANLGVDWWNRDVIPRPDAKE
jgi:hypothetical protein